MAAWLVSSAVFGIVHVHPTVAVNAFAIGLVLGFVYMRTDSLWSTIILHAVNNGIAYLALVTGHGNAMLIDLVGSRTLYVLIYIGALAVFAVSGYMMLLALRRLKAEDKKSGGGVIIWAGAALVTSKNCIFVLRIMNLRAKIAVVAASVFLAGCREMPGYFASDTTLARAGGKRCSCVMWSRWFPKGVTGEDSAAFMKVYVDRWVRKQLKLKEAETLFSASGDDIDKMVEEYRQALLIRKLNQLYVDRSIDTTFTDDEITAYYNAHKADFRLDRTLVKGRIVQFGEGYRQARKLKELMGGQIRRPAAGFPGHLREKRLHGDRFPGTVGRFSGVSEFPADPQVAELRFGAVVERRAGDARQPFVLLFPDRRRAARGASLFPSNACGVRSAAFSSTSGRARSSAATRRSCTTAPWRTGEAKIFENTNDKV